MNRRRILAFLGLAPIVAATAVKAIASEPSLWAGPIGSDDIMAIAADLPIDDDFWRSVQYCYVAPRGTINPFVGQRPENGGWSTCYKICDGSGWVDCDSNEGHALMNELVEDQSLAATVF